LRPRRAKELSIPDALVERSHPLWAERNEPWGAGRVRLAARSSGNVKPGIAILRQKLSRTRFQPWSLIERLANATGTPISFLHYEDMIATRLNVAPGPESLGGSQRWAEEHAFLPKAVATDPMASCFAAKKKSLKRRTVKDSARLRVWTGQPRLRFSLIYASFGFRSYHESQNG